MCICAFTSQCPRFRMPLTSPSSSTGIQNTTITATERPRKRRMKATVSNFLCLFCFPSTTSWLTAPLVSLSPSPQLKTSGKTRGPAPVLAVKPPLPGRQREPTENTHTEDTDRLLVERCHGNCIRL